MSASPAAPLRSNRHRSRSQRSLIFPSSTVLHEPVPRDGMGLPTLLWLGQYSPHIVAGRQPSRQSGQLRLPTGMLPKCSVTTVPKEFTPISDAYAARSHTMHDYL